MEPWFDGPTAGLIGGIAGSLIGVIGGGVWGTCARIWAPKGRHRKLITVSAHCFTAIGALLLITGGVAFFLGQPYHVWYPFFLLGLIMAILFPCIFYFDINKQYMASELRKMQIDDMK